MTFTDRSRIALFILLLSLVSGVNGEVTVIASTGDPSGSSSYTESIGASVSDNIEEIISLGSSRLSDSFKGSGDAAKKFTVTNDFGDHADVGFDIKKSISYSGRYTLSPKTANYAQATENLNVDTADSIHAYANAISRNGHTAGAWIDVASGSIRGYSNSAYANANIAETNQKVSSSKASNIKTWDIASNSGITTYANSQTSSDSLTGFDSTATMTAAGAETNLIIKSASSASGNELRQGTQGWSLSGNEFLLAGTTSGGSSRVSANSVGGYSSKIHADEDGITATVDINSVSGNIPYSTYAEHGVYSPRSFKQSSSNGFYSEGLIRGYHGKAEATPSQTETSQKIEFASASGGLAYASSRAANEEGDVAETYINIYDGTILKYSDAATATSNKVNNRFDLNAKGTLVDVGSHVENKKPTDESAPTGPEGVDIVNKGAGDFDIHAKGGLNMKISQYATSGSLLITPNLPKNIKKAIVLEPYHTVFDQEYNQNVIPAMLDQGYSVLRYTDSGVSRETFTNLNEYNLVLINSHMLASSISLNHNEKLDAFTLREWYNTRKPPADSIVILAGCQSLGVPANDPSWWTNYFASLNDAFKKAGTRVGYSKTTYEMWAKGSMAKLFIKLSEGYTMRQAVDYVNSEYMDEFDSAAGTKDYSPELKINGNGNVKL